MIGPSGWLAWERFRCNTDCLNDPENCISGTILLIIIIIMIIIISLIYNIITDYQSLKTSHHDHGWPHLQHGLCQRPWKLYQRYNRPHLCPPHHNYDYDHQQIASRETWSERLFKSMADQLILGGWREAGFDTIIMDDCWLAPHRWTWFS